MAKSTAVELEEILHAAWTMTESYRQGQGAKPRQMLEKRDKAKDGQPKNWWGPKSYKVTLWFSPWHFIKLMQNMNDAGYTSVHQYIKSFCTDARLMGVLEEVGLKRKPKKEGKVVPLRRKKTPAVAAPHYGLPTRRRALKVAHG